MKAAAIAITILVIALGGTVAVYEHLLANQREDLRAAALSLDSLQAVQDSTREVTVALRNAIADSSRVFERRIVQVESERDLLDEALGRESIARTRLQLALDSVRGRTEAPVSETPEGDRTASFQETRPPFTLTADVTLPPPPASGVLEWTVKVAPFEISPRIQCGDQSPVRQATVLIEVPSWIEAEVLAARAHPDVCNAPALSPPTWHWPTAIHVGAAGAAIAGTAAGKPLEGVGAAAVLELLNLIRGFF